VLKIVKHALAMSQISVYPVRMDMSLILIHLHVIKTFVSQGSLCIVMIMETFNVDFVIKTV